MNKSFIALPASILTAIVGTIAAEMMAGLGVIIGVVLGAVILAGIAIWLINKRKEQADE